ncbi:MAG: hypothetical protein ACXWQO_19755, partial [Bdellovibrionota bacterium]
KQPLKATAQALTVRPSRLKLMGLFACETDKYYRKPFQQANPDMDMILSREELGDEAGEQASIGTINALLTKKCAKDFNKSLRSVSTDAPGKMEYIHSGGKATAANSQIPTPAERPSVPAEVKSAQ